MPVSTVECTASANIAPEPLNPAATYLAAASAALPISATMATLVEALAKRTSPVPQVVPNSRRVKHPRPGIKSSPMAGIRRPVFYLWTCPVPICQFRDRLKQYRNPNKCVPSPAP